MALSGLLARLCYTFSSFSFLNADKLSQDPLDGFSRSLYQMIGIALIMTDLDLFFDSPRDVAIPTDFMAKFRYMHSFGRAAFENGLQYRHSDSKIFNGNILAIVFANMM